MQDEKRNVRITGAQVKQILKQNRLMRELLESWPPRAVMMGYEKDWDLRRRAFLKEQPPLTLPAGDDEGT